MITRKPPDGERSELDAVLSQIQDLSDRDRHADVVRACTEFIEQFGPDSRLYYYRAHSKLLLKDRSGAVSDLTEAIAYDPEEPAQVFFRGLWSIDLGDYAGALRDLQTAIDLEAKLGSSYYVSAAKIARSVAFLCLGQFTLAEEECSDLEANAQSFVSRKLWSVAEVRSHAVDFRRPL